MKFKRIDVETVRCLISEDELLENGLDMDDFLCNGEKTEEFLHKIVTLAEEQVGYRIPGGSLSVQASILPNHVLSLTLSEKQGQSILDILKNLKNAMTKLSEAVASDDTEAFKNILEALGATDTRERIGLEDGGKRSSSGIKEHYELEFDNLDTIMKFAAATEFPDSVSNVIYRLERTGFYYLVLHKGRLTDDKLCLLLSASLDFANCVYSDGALLAYLDEHGERILSENAMQTLQRL